jgi:outer membrane protein assembly factor BamE (lipoprotein component of BamABCDE complex)
MRAANRNTCARQQLQVGFALALCATLLGCIGATPLPKRTRTPTGTEAKDIDISFIHVGQTARAEVKEKLKLIDTGYEGEHFFLGRWSSSTWGGWYVLAGYYNAAAGGGRVWKSGNLLVQFDSAGVVTSSTLFDDAKAISILVPVAADTALQLASPLELQVKYYLLAGGQLVDAKIVLSKGTFEFEELGERKKKQNLSLPASEVLRVETPVTIRFPDPIYISQRLHCARDLKKIGGPRGRDLNLEVTLPQLVTLMRYVGQEHAQPFK